MAGPHELILKRQESVERAKDIIQQGNPTLTLMVNRATYVAEITALMGGGPLYELAPCTLYRHVLELADGISVLLAQSCVMASTPLLRALYEAHLFLQYICVDGETEAVRRRRALCYLCVSAHRQVRAAQRYDQKTPVGRSQAQRWGRELNQPMPIGDSAPAAWQKILDAAEMRDIEREYQRTASEKRDPPFYTLFSGPKKMQELAVSLDRSARFGPQCRPWSVYTHGAVPDVDLHGFEELRSSEQLVSYYADTVLLLHRATVCLHIYLRPDLTALYEGWFEVNIKDELKKLDSLQSK